MRDWWKSIKTVRSHYKSKKVKRTRSQHHTIAKCVVCSARFQTARAHAKCCSSACRMRLNRFKGTKEALRFKHKIA